MKIPGLAALLLSLPVLAFAQSDATYRPKPGATLVVHVPGKGYSPDGVTLTNAAGTFLITRDELFKRFAIDNAEEQTLYNLWDFTETGVRHRGNHRDLGEEFAYAGAESVARLEALLARMAPEKKAAAAEAAGRVQSLRSRADRSSALRSALLASETLAPGTVKDKAWLERLDSDVAAARAAADKADGELKGASEARFIRVARIMTGAEYEMWKLENVLDWSPAGK